MTLRFLIVATFTVALASCTSVGRDEAQAPLDPAACYTRDFNVYFEDQTTELTPAAREVIGAMVDPLRGCRINHVRIIGSAEAAGSEIVNEDRSAERALGAGSLSHAAVRLAALEYGNARHRRARRGHRRRAECADAPPRADHDRSCCAIKLLLTRQGKDHAGVFFFLAIAPHRGVFALNIRQ